MEFEKIRRELQESQRSYLEEREEEEDLEHLDTIRDVEQKPDTASTTEEEPEINQQRNQIYKLKEKNRMYEGESKCKGKIHLTALI